MNLANLPFKLSYSSPEDDIVHDFLEPALKRSIEYNRASGYFSSSSLLDLIDGIEGLVKNGGKIKLVISPNLSQKDQEAIENGYKLRNQENRSIKEELINSFVPPQNSEEEERYNILSHLIRDNILDIKVAVMKNNPLLGLFHDKIGILKDDLGNFVAFSGSMNETANGFYHNHENIDVYTSSGRDFDRAMEKLNRFNDYWNNQSPSIEVFDFPENLKDKIREYEKPEMDWDKVNHPRKKHSQPKGPYLPDSIKLRPYQVDAIDKWQQHGFHGIYDMATGTGKTITALASIVRLRDSIKGPLAIIIVVPYIHLVTQWAKDLKKFNIEAIQGFAQSPNKNWKEEFSHSIRKLKVGLVKTICLISTNASFRTKATQDIVNQINAPMLLIVDEAHNFGSKSLAKTLDDRYQYRLALSATLDRQHDEKGTELLRSYFAPVCIKYSLEQAIEDGMLTPYRYYPVPVSLSDDEFEEYMKLTVAIGKHIKKKKNGEIEIDSIGKNLLIKRARLIAGAINKLTELEEIISELPDRSHLLVYCGATTVDESASEYTVPKQDEVRQIEAVSGILINKFGLNSAMYTAEVKSEDRKRIIRDFDDGVIDSLVAIRCLDEGVDIPSIDKAIFLASSTNPKEYVQRRGRVLRLYPNKIMSTIIDLVTLPRDLDDLEVLPQEIGLVKRELERVEEFANAAINAADSDQLIQRIKDKYWDFLYRNDNEEDEFYV